MSICIYYSNVGRCLYMYIPSTKVLTCFYGMCSMYVFTRYNVQEPNISRVLYSLYEYMSENLLKCFYVMCSVCVFPEYNVQ